MSPEINQEISFPVGYHAFHRDQLFNFQLNRWYSFGFFGLEEARRAGAIIRTFSDWKAEMVELAENAVSENRPMSAALFYRAAEFYTMKGDNPGKEYYYDRFHELFYRAIEGDGTQKIRVPYGSLSLPALRLVPAKKKKKGTIVMHGGFDSFIEEFYYLMKYLARAGYEVIGFEGPGQGNVLLKQGAALDYRWERPVGAVLDHLAVNKATLFGLSMGGWFCLRAAAFEPRIKNVIAGGHAVDYMKIPPAFAQWLMTFFIRHFRKYTERSFEKAMRKGGMQSWQIGNLMHMTKMESPLGAFEYIMQLNQSNLHPELVRQHVLYLTARNDHFIPFKMHAMQVRALTNAASLTDRVFTKKEHAHNHCQVGNIRLMLDTIVDWLKDR